MGDSPKKKFVQESTETGKIRIVSQEEIAKGTSSRGDLSATVAPPDQPIDAPPSNIEAVDTSDKKSAMPEGKEWLSRAHKFLKEDFDKGENSRFRHTKFGPAMMYGLGLLNTMFGFALDPVSFNKLSSNLYPTVNFGDETKTILKKRLSERYIELSNSKVTTNSEFNKKVTNLNKLEARLLKLGMTKEDIEKLGEVKLGGETLDERLKQQLTELNIKEMMDNDEKFKKLMKTDRADSVASVLYVYRELGASYPVPDEGQTLGAAYDAHALNSRLQNAKFTDKSTYEYKVHGTDKIIKHDKSTMEKLYDKEENASKVLSAYVAGTLPAGTVVFFERAGILMTGIVNLDGKIRYQTKDELNVLEDFSGEDSTGKKIMNLVDDYKVTAKGAEFIPAKKSEDVNSSQKFSSFIDMFAQGGFKGAFIPNFGPDTQEDVEYANKGFEEYNTAKEDKEKKDEAREKNKLPEEDKGKTLQELRAELAEETATDTATEADSEPVADDVEALDEVVEAASSTEEDKTPEKVAEDEAVKKVKEKQTVGEGEDAGNAAS
jgi:hypothetical protein